MTTIEWTEESLNPIRARNLATGKKGHFCVKVGPECKHCYAEGFQSRLQNPIRFAAQDRELVDIYLDEDVLRRPLGWKRGKRIFPCSMTDLFAEFHPDAWIDAMLGVAALTPQHTYQCLTKRAKRMHDYFTLWPDGSGRKNHVFCAILRLLKYDAAPGAAPGAARDEIIKRAQDAVRVWPLPNWWQGVSVGTQAAADEMIPLLLRTDLSLRWLSLEPLLEEVDVSKYLPNVDWRRGVTNGAAPWPVIDWGVVGGESGQRARPTNIEHVKSIVRQFAVAGRALFVKQLGARPFDAKGEIRLQSPKGGDLSEWTRDLQVREYPR